MGNHKVLLLAVQHPRALGLRDSRAFKGAVLENGTVVGHPGVRELAGVVYKHTRSGPTRPSHRL